MMLSPAADKQAVSSASNGRSTTRASLDGIRAVLFDFDGTLYGQSPLRALMALELMSIPLLKGSWHSATQTWTTIAEFRRVREALRDVSTPSGSLTDLQFAETARRVRREQHEVEQCVAEWIARRPLKYLRYTRRTGLVSLLRYLEANRIPAGVLSDYPVAEKLEALGLAGRFSVLICATDPDVNAFKPHPAGFLRACDLWGLPPYQVLYVGDRPDVDATGAAAAGMPCAIVAPGRWIRRQQWSSLGYLEVPHLRRLQYVLDHRG